MPLCGRHGWLLLVGCAICVAGCGAAPPVPYPTWAPSERAYAPSPTSGNAYDGYLIAAREAESAAGDLARHVSFTGRHRNQLLERTSSAFRKLQQASSKPSTFQFRSSPPFELDPDYAGLRILRLTTLWRIEDAIKAENLDRAVELANMGSKVGSDLAAGGAMDADLGLQWMDDIRKTIAPILARLTVAQLSRLTAGQKRALDSLPAFETIVRNERLNFLQGVQWIQDAYAKGDFATIDTQFGTPVRDATTYLKGVAKNDREKRPAYFQGFAKEADIVADWYIQQSTKPLIKRQPLKDMPVEKERPWRRYAGQLFTTLAPVLTRYDATVARTRLLVLTSEIRRQIKVARMAPRSLDAFTKDLRTDPLTGESFKYRAAGMEFYLYSVGPNFQDDQGQTDGIYTNPDLVLESR